MELCDISVMLQFSFPLFSILCNVAKSLKISEK
nr:MAG TPA: hypothetical protein [Caudoviricetes sp.]